MPSPDAAEAERLLAGLTAVDPGLTTSSTDYTVWLARNICNTLTVPASPGPHRERAAELAVAFARANSVALSASQADRTVDVVGETFCPTIAPAASPS